MEVTNVWSTVPTIATKTEAKIEKFGVNTRAMMLMEWLAESKGYSLGRVVVFI